MSAPAATSDIPVTAFDATASRRALSRWARVVAGMLHRFAAAAVTDPGPTRWT